MAAQRQGTSTWLNVYPIADGARQWDSQNAVFVDVGGGFGHQCAALQAAYPNLPGQIILQDLPQATAHALPLPGVKIMTHDFFQPQPIEGAIHTLLFASQKLILLQERSIIIFETSYTITPMRNVLRS